MVGKKELTGPQPTEPATEAPPGDTPVPGQMVFYYDYFPDAEVYYDTIRHLYFYQENNTWIMSVALPTAFQARTGTSVRLKLTTSRPYSLHQEHRMAYPPDPDRPRF